LPYSRIGKSLLEFNLEIMQRKILLIISIFVFITFSQTTNAQSKKKSDAEIEGFKGNIMSVMDKYYEEKRTFFDLIPIKVELSNTFILYNKEGNLILEKENDDFTENNRDISYYKYNNRGNCIEQIDSSYEDGRAYSMLWQNTYNYDINGKIIEEYSYLDGMFAGKYLYKYDKNGDYIEIISYKDEEDTIPTKEIFIRDNKGNIIESKKYSYFGDSRTIYKYDDKGNLIKDEYFFQEDTISTGNLYKYNIENDIIEKIHFDNQTKTKYIALKFKYKYDSKGNWIKRTDYKEDGSIENIIKRKIKYYDE